jgi:hypothetical protein
MRAFSVLAFSTAILAGAAAAADAQQFSADIMRIDPQGAPAVKAGTLRVADGKVRIETPDLPDGFFLIDTERDAAWFVRPSRRQYMEARQSSRLTQIFVPVDPAEPCGQWRRAASRAGDLRAWHCSAVGAAFELSAGPQDHEKRWIDSALRFPVKAERADGSMLELQHIERAAQSERLFQIPADFHRFDPEQLIKRIKQSDVWAEPPK